ncbi:uncharacterized protein LOC122919834 [Bufo gargarizans]|uniref:uncharacterized protein LOC122919834 n=1 Tax=Bufo gargarizans TaxID=30331 RepID=UPI001CF18E1B|nr:uncharacterized protein LOC122919834 [Bufo gargarizans]
MSVRKNSVASVAPSEAPQVDQGSPAQDRRSEVIHPDDHEVALQRSISNAIITAMGSMSSALTQSISQALMARPATTTQVLVPPPGPPPIVSRTPQIDGPSPSQDNALQSRKRACTRQAEKTRAWKTARSLPEPRSDSDRESEEETHDNVYELTDEVEDDLADIAVDPVRNLDPEAPLLQQGSAEDLLLDPSGEPLFNPEELHHPRSAEWMPATHVAQYMEARIRNPLSKESRNKLRAECPRPLIPHKVCETPSVDPKMVQFLAKTGFNPRKGLDAALKAVQDKLLDITGPLAKIFDLAESAIAAGSQVDPIELRGWAQRAICVAGNTNTSLAIERRKAILIKIEPKLSNLALTEAGKDAQGLLFGDSFIKELGKYVGAFTALDKAQTSMRRVFQGRFSNRAGSARGRLSGRSNFHARGSGRGSFNYRASLQDQRHQPSFFPSRGAPFRSRGFRGNPGSRRPFGKLCSSSPSFFRPFSRGQTPILFSCVVRHNLRPMGPFYCAGVHNRSDCRSELHPSPPYGTTVLCGTVPISEGIVGSSAERRDRTRTGESWGCHQQYFPGAKEQFCTIPTFQDGGHPSFEGSAPSRRLVGQDRSPRRLSHGPSVPLFKRPAAVPVERSGLALHLPSVRPVLRPLVLYQDHAPSGGLASQQRCSSDRLPGRYLDHGPITGSLVETPPLDGDARFRLGVHCQPGEILFDPLQIHRVLGFPGELGRIIPQSSTLESQGYPQGVEACSTPTSDVVAAFGKDNRTSGLLNTGHFPSPPPLSCVAAPQNCSPSVGGLLRRFGLIRCQDDGRDEMVDPQPVSVEWQSDQESHLHINALELLAGSFAIRSFANGVVSSAIRLRMDNISAVRNISVVAEYLPGLHNTLADWSSRYISDSSDWKLDETVFSAISSLWGPFAVDLFASRLNTQLPRFFSWRPDPLAEAVDALLQHWGGALMYAFPPFALIPRVLLQVRQQLANLVLIVPFWRTQSWFPQILELLVDFPFLLPTQVSLLQGPAGEVHPLLQNGSLRLLACKISGVQEEALDFQEQLGSYWTALGRPGRDGLIEPPGVLGLAGASTGLWIPLRPLSIPS